MTLTSTEHERIDTFRHTYRLERRSRGLNHLRTLYAPPEVDPGRLYLESLTGGAHTSERVGAQLGARLIGVFLKPDLVKAWDAYKKMRPTTIGQQMALLLNEQEFRAIHEDLHRFLRIQEESIKEAVTSRLVAGGDFERADCNQFNGEELASLARMRSEGIRFRVRPDDLGLVLFRDRKAEDGPIPVIEMMKRERCVDIDGLQMSKISHIIHDLIDHLWAFDLIDRCGLFDEFAELFGSIGDPHLRDIRSREGETVASIAFGVRYFRTTEPGLVPTVSAVRLRQLLFRPAGRCEGAPWLDEARRILADATTHGPRDRDAACLESASLSFVFSNYLTELDEQRRKHGKIKQRTPDGLRELPVFGHEYLAFLVRAHHEILRPKNKHLDTLAKAHLMIEEFFIDLADERLRPPYEMTIRLEDLERYQATSTRVPHSRVQWIAQNFGFTAAKLDVI